MASTFLLLLTSPPRALAAAPPELNRLQGLVVAKADGRPLSDIQIVMTHEEKGTLRIGPRGRLEGFSAEDDQPRDFATRNHRFFCDAFTDDQGRFTLRSFAAPQERWNLAAGDSEHGLALLRGVVPAEYADKPLRIEIDAAADIEVARPAPPADKSLESVVDVALAPAPSTLAERSTTDSEPAVREQPEEAGERVFFYAAWQPEDEAEPWRLGPLPPGYTYRVTCRLYGRRLGYNPTAFERAVSLSPGATAAVTLESPEGARITGRLTDAGGQPLADVNVLVKLGDGSGVIVGALSDAAGRYALGGVPAGAHTLELLRHEARTAPT